MDWRVAHEGKVRAANVRRDGASRQGQVPKSEARFPFAAKGLTGACSRRASRGELAASWAHCRSGSRSAVGLARARLKRRALGDLVSYCGNCCANHFSFLGEGIIVSKCLQTNELLEKI
jgi:hypothetical protein